MVWVKETRYLANEGNQLKQMSFFSLVLNEFRELLATKDDNKRWQLIVEICDNYNMKTITETIIL